MGVYRGRLVEPAGRTRTFRLLLHAASPDRLHAELLGPIGGPQLILDGGGGKLAVTLVEEGRTYLGDADARTLARVLGVELSLRDLVRALLEGESTDGGCRVERQAASPVGLPRRVAIACPRGRRLELELRRFVPLAWPATGLGSAQAPEGTEILPLEALELSAPLGGAERSP